MYSTNDKTLKISQVPVHPPSPLPFHVSAHYLFHCAKDTNLKALSSTYLFYFHIIIPLFCLVSLELVYEILC